MYEIVSQKKIRSVFEMANQKQNTNYTARDFLTFQFPVYHFGYQNRNRGKKSINRMGISLLNRHNNVNI